MSRVYIAPAAPSARQGGVTLVEMMIALVLGALIVAGVVQVFLSGRASYNVQEGLGRLQESARFADFTLARVLRQAGRPWVFGSVNGSPGPFFRPVDARVGPDGQPLTRDGEDDGADVVTVMYRSDTNCLGNSTDYGGQVMLDFEGQRYARDQFLLNDDDPPSLVCRGLGANGQPVPGHTQPIVAGVDDLQLLYGLDTDGDGQANRYDNASNLVDPLDWFNVVSLRFAVLVSSDAAVRASDDEQVYALLDAPLRGPFDDGRLRMVVESTVELRNRSR